MKTETTKAKIESLIKLNKSNEEIFSSETLVGVKKNTIKWYLNKLKKDETK